MIMIIIGIAPKHIQQGAEVVLGETPAQVVVIRVSPAYAVHVTWGQQSDGYGDPSLACTVYDVKFIQYALRAGRRRKSWYSSKLFVVFK